MNWSRHLFFYIVLAFAVYVFTVNDQSKWLALFTKSQGGGNGLYNPNNPLPSAAGTAFNNAQQQTNQYLGGYGQY